MKPKLRKPHQPQLVGNYKVVKKIGEGGFGKALLVEMNVKDPTIKPTLFVAKQIRIEELHERDLNQAVREAMLLAQFSNHPFVVHYSEAFVQDGDLYVIMDYCERGDLERKIREKRERNRRFTEREVLVYFCQMLAAIHYLHDHKVLHRDIKPSNFLVTKEGKLVLSDFGISKSFETIQLARTFTGTIPFMSPEILKGVPYSYPADIWALGCVLYELLTLKMPFMNFNQEKLMASIASHAPPSLPRDISPGLRQLCMSLLEKKPEIRPSASDLIKHPLVQKTLPELLKLSKKPPPVEVPKKSSCS